MKTIDALRLYNTTEYLIKKEYPFFSAVERAKKIEILLTDLYGEDISDEIIDLVFEHEFYPCGLNKNE